ncbi:alpha-ketoglutarate-dependent dioxygenase AlkB [Euhalothece natronophila Z-M001]|uniref:Alpha-ketoglutarate-dependent dioxygenase AlkB n=1 Tax=Euhalothece natronophila Z-M001 TaxID=522448 RepID=A0A5B8NHZ4_9CHRO|nr:alpha-ketoglutarate-dependent dioxygenase AlkB [Euhalothece natronophila]QDZ38574.1 alpha-ketoglutarate-dependent dioxygenase AlkB [Euhalothece natronophila Z-M001]
MSEQLTIFSQEEKLNLPHSDIKIYRNFFDAKTSDYFFSQLEKEINWKQEYIKLYGKENPVPRLTAWYGDKGYSYTYSGITMNPEPWTNSLLEIKHKIETIAQVNFNSVLLNLYRDGNDGVAWHSDDEPELGKHPIIGSVSLGGERRFSFKYRDKSNPERHDINLKHGDFLLMQGETQQYWYHQIPKTKKSVLPRINLTFRVIY